LAKYVQWLKYYCHKSIFFVIYYVGRYLTLYVVSSGIRTHNVSGDRHWLHSYKSNYRTITTATAPRNKYIIGILLKVVLSTITLTFTCFSKLDLIFDFWCLMPLSEIFQLYHGDQF